MLERLPPIEKIAVSVTANNRGRTAISTETSVRPQFLVLFCLESPAKRSIFECRTNLLATVPVNDADILGADGTTIINDVLQKPAPGERLQYLRQR